jgi:hypothetical protein
VIAQEAGGFVTGSKDVLHDGVVTEAILTGRRYLVIRGVAGTLVRTDQTCLSVYLTNQDRRRAASRCKNASRMNSTIRSRISRWMNKGGVDVTRGDNCNWW